MTNDKVRKIVFDALKNSIENGNVVQAAEYEACNLQTYCADLEKVPLWEIASHVRAWLTVYPRGQ